MVYLGDPCIGITLTQGKIIFQLTLGNTIFPLKTHQWLSPSSFSLPPPPLPPLLTPIPALHGGKSRFPSCRCMAKVPIWAMSPCPVQTLAGALGMIPNIYPGLPYEILLTTLLMLIFTLGKGKLNGKIFLHVFPFLSGTSTVCSVLAR